MTEHSPRFLADLIDQMSDGVYFVDRSRRILFWSGGAERLTGHRADDVVGRSCRDGVLNHVDEYGNELCKQGCPLLATILDGKPRETHVYLQHADGHRHPVFVRASPLIGPDGQISGAVEVFSDDSAGRAVQERLNELERLALLDPLTGLGNRRFLEMNLDARLLEWSRYGLPFGILFADVDHFKHVNDTYGHDVGDETLAMVARTIASGLRGTDVAARYGGEEFVVVAREDSDGLQEVGERLRTLVSASRLVIARQPIAVTISLGGAMVKPGDNGTTLLRRADLALQAAKQAGRNRVHQ